MKNSGWGILRLLLKFVKTKKMDEWTWDNLKQFAQKSGLSESLVLYEAMMMLDKFFSLTQRAMQDPPLTPEQFHRIMEHALKIPLSKGQSS